MLSDVLKNELAEETQAAKAAAGESEPVQLPKGWKQSDDVANDMRVSLTRNFGSEQCVRAGDTRVPARSHRDADTRAGSS